MTMHFVAIAGLLKQYSLVNICFITKSFLVSLIWLATPAFESVDRLNNLEPGWSRPWPCGVRLKPGVPALANLIWMFFGQAALHELRSSSGFFAEEFHLLLAGRAPVRTKKFGSDLVELVCEFHCSLYGFRRGLRNRTVPGLCSHHQAWTPRKEGKTGQDVDTSHTAHWTLLNSVFYSLKIYFMLTDWMSHAVSTSWASCLRSPSI